MRPKHLCGFAGWHPKWLQKFANIKIFMIVFGLLGTTQGMTYLYFYATLTTIEKRFKIPSGTTGIILSGFELSQILLSLILSYVGGQRNRPKWISWGMTLCGMSCFILALPHFMYGPGDDALELTQEYLNEYRNISSLDPPSSRAGKLCLGAVTSESCDDELFSIVPLIILYLAQFVLGIGQTLYFSLGQSYLDDNTQRTNTASMLSYALSLRMCGPVAGYGLAYLTLKLYIDPTKTPVIDNKDPRWLGAWWIGFIFLGVVMLLFSFLIRMFPLRMQRKEPLNLQNDEEPLNGKVSEMIQEVPVQSDNLPKLKDFPKALTRLLRNKVLIFNIISTVFYTLGSTGYIQFLSKYIEVQFNKSPSDATILTGPLTIAGMVIGFLLSGIVIKRYKPSPRKLSFWNVFVGVCFMAGQVSYVFLSCEQSNTTNLVANLTSNCNMNCYCDEVGYNPVCSVETGTTFFSPCHAACSKWDDEKKVYLGCACAAEVLEVNRTFQNDPMDESLTTNSATFIDREAYNFRASRTTKFLSGISDNDVKHETDGERKKSKEGEKHQNFMENIMTPGPCLTGCANTFYIFTFVMCAVNWLNSTGRIGNVLLILRAVADKEKAFSQGLSLMLVSLCGYTPAPIIFGYIIDSTCLVWNYSCENRRGNCQLYDAEKFRYYLNVTGISLTFLGVLFDVLVWRHSKNLNLYSEPDDENRTNQIEQNEKLQQLMVKNSFLCQSCTSLERLK